MRKSVLLVLGLALTFALTANAQTKISGTVSCAKPDPAYSIEVGDRAGHSFSINKSACTWTTPLEIAGLQAKDGLDVSFGDASGARVRAFGYHVATMSNGDKFFVRYQGRDTMKDGKPDTTEGTWSYTGGTGKLKGIKGKGTYKGNADANGTFVVAVEGEYELPASK